jgi:Phage capsid family
MATKLAQKQAEKTEKANRLAAFFESKKTPEGLVMTKAETEKVQADNAELDALSIEVKGLYDLDAIEAKNLQRIEEQNTVPRPGGYSVKGTANPYAKGGDGAILVPSRRLGDLYLDSKGYKERGSNKQFECAVPDFETKTLFSTTAGWDPFVERLGRVAMSPQQLPRIVDAFALGTTTQHSIKFMLETTYTNAAAGTLEGGSYPESALKLTEQLMPVVKVGNFLPVTDEQLQDEDGARDYLNNRLTLMVRQALDQGLVSGSGTIPQLTGIANISGIQSFAKAGGDATTDAILKAMVLVQTVGFCEPTAALLHPTDWMNVRLLKTADGLYIWGHPSQAGPASIWGLPVITSTYFSVGTGYVGDWLGNFMLFMRRGIEFATTNSHASFFQTGMQAIRADLRCALACFRATAVCQFSGL